MEMFHHYIWMRKGIITLCLFLMFLSLSVAGYSQNVAAPVHEEYGLRGVIVEAQRSDDIPIAFARIRVRKSDGKIAVEGFSLEDGSFQVKVAKGSYEVVLSATGHKTKILTLDAIDSEADLGVIRLEEGEEISAAGIVSESLIERRGTRIRYDVSKDPDAKRIKMLEMIARIPDLQISALDGRLHFEGKGLSSILIDNEENGFINNSRQYPMEFIRADYMKTVELVLPGDHEYNNQDPILLIRLARPLPYGFGSSLGMRSTTKNNHQPSVDVIANTPIIGIGLNYGYEYSGAPSLTEMVSRDITDPTSETGEIETVTSRWQERSMHNISTNLFRDVAGDRIRFNARVSTSYSDGVSGSESSSVVRSADGKGLTNTMSEKGEYKSPFRINGAMRLSGRFGGSADRVGMKKNRWQVEYAYRNSVETNKHAFTTYEYLASSSLEEHKATVSMDLPRIIKAEDFVMSSGFKGGYYDRHYDTWNAAPGESTGMDYHQRVAYLNFLLLASTCKQRLGFMLTLNNEFLSNGGDYVVETLRFPLNYDAFNVNPLAGVSWNFRKGSVGTSYSRNVRRPKITQLNPYEDRSDPFLIRRGNPDLKGEVTDCFALNTDMRTAGKLFKGITLSASYSTTRDRISGIVELSNEGKAVSTYCNIGSYRILTLNAKTNMSLHARLRGTVNLAYSFASALLPSGLMNQYQIPSASVYLSWNAPWFELSGNLLVSPTIRSVQTTSLAMEPAGEISVSKYFDRKHFGISLSVTDVFHKAGFMVGDIMYDGFSQHTRIEREGRAYMLNVYWRFGKFKDIPRVEVDSYDM